jgi:hypothetical protein
MPLPGKLGPLLQIGAYVRWRQEFILSDFIINARCYDVT